MRRVWIGICLGALMPKRTRFLPTSRMVISISSARMIFWSFLRLIISIGTHPFSKSSYLCRELPRTKNTAEFCPVSTFSQKLYYFQYFSGRIVPR